MNCRMDTGVPVGMGINVCPLVFVFACSCPPARVRLFVFSCSCPPIRARVRLFVLWPFAMSNESTNGHRGARWYGY